MICATAGHVDHGKTALVRALTGTDTDRLPEEKARGLTIDLGFAYLPLAAGGAIGFIDVPGHERFLRNMVAGVPGIDLALLAIAADDGIMPQTREHVAVLALLGVGRALPVLTKADLASPARIERVAADAAALLARHGLDAPPAVATAAPQGRGIAALRLALLAEAGRLAAAGEDGGGFRLAVDRAFVVAGAGVVVTGTVHAGRVAVGERLVLLPGGRDLRLRGLHAQGRPAGEARRGQRAALNLAGIGRGEARRGDWVATPGILAPSRRLDVALTVPAAERNGRGLRHGAALHVHHGAAHATARVALLETAALAAGESGLAQLVLDQPLVAAYGDRLLLRDPHRGLAGGRAIDPAAPARGRRRPERLRRLRAMDRAGAGEAALRLLEAAPEGIDLAAFAATRNLPAGHLDAALDGRATVFGPAGRRRHLLRSHWRSLADRVLEALAADHLARPERPGPSPGELRLALARRPPPPLLAAVLEALERQGRLARRGAAIHLPGHRVRLPPGEAALWARVRAALEVEAGSPPALFPLAAGLGMESGALERFLARMAACGLVVAIARHRYLTPAQIERAGEAARRAARRAPQGFGVAAFRDAAGIGRNLAVDLLEYLDSAGVTRRRGDLRQLTAPDRARPPA